MHAQHLAAGLVCAWLQYRARRHAEVGGCNRFLQTHQVHAPFPHAGRINVNLDGAARRTQCGDFAHTRNGLELSFQGMGYRLQLAGRCGAVAPQGNSDNRHVINTFGLDDGCQGAQVPREPILVGVEHVIQAHQRLGTGHTHFELDSQHRHARTGDRIGVLDAGDLAQHLLCRLGHHVLDIGAAGARKRNQHVGHGDVDLGLFLTRSHQHSEQAQQQGHQGQEGRQCIRLERGGDTPGCAKSGGGVGVVVHGSLGR